MIVNVRKRPFFTQRSTGNRSFRFSSSIMIATGFVINHSRATDSRRQFGFVKRQQTKEAFCHLNLMTIFFGYN